MYDPIDFVATSNERSKGCTYTFGAKNFAHWHIVVFAFLVDESEGTIKIFRLNELDEVSYELVWRHLVILADERSAQRITRCVACGRECQWAQQP